jgi:hypothetical protein
MNHYTTLLIYLKGLFEKDPLVNIVTKGAIGKKALDKMTVFPMVNVIISQAHFTNGGSIGFSLIISAVDQRDINKEISDDLFWGNDNQADIMNETISILNRAWTTMHRDFTRAGISVAEGAVPVPIEGEGKNLVDGWEVEFDVYLPNKELSLCQYN